MSKYEYTIGKELDLGAEQEKTLSSPLLKKNLFMSMMVIVMDIIYGKKGSLPKFMVLEVLARYPYWAWEQGGYTKMTRAYSRKGRAKKKEFDEAVDLIDLGRRAQDNEQCHLMLIEDIMRQKNIRLGVIRRSLIPRMMAFGYYYMTRLIYNLCPVCSFEMNAAFESHAEREYMKMAKENPAWNDEPVESEHFAYYPKQKSLGDLLRRIGLDERDHMNESLQKADKIKHKKTCKCGK